MPQSREQICRSAARVLETNAPRISDFKATVGLDGFVDEIIGVVDTRHDLENCDLVPTIAAFGQKVSAASGKSANFELVVKQMKLGGNGPIMANALAAAGLA